MEIKMDISEIEFEDFSGSVNVSAHEYLNDDIVKLADLKLKVTAELGKRKATVGEVSNYDVGDYIEVERLAGHAVDIYIGKEKIAIGEIMEMDNNNFGLKIMEVVTKNGEFLKYITKNGEIE